AVFSGKAGRGGGDQGGAKRQGRIAKHSVTPSCCCIAEIVVERVLSGLVQMQAGTRQLLKRARRVDGLWSSSHASWARPDGSKQGQWAAQCRLRSFSPRMLNS